MKEYRIAFLTADWNYELVETTLHGLKKYVNEHDNVRVCVFDCFGKETDTPKDKSEYAIYDLVDLSSFDGVLVQGNQLVQQKMRDRIGRRIKDRYKRYGEFPVLIRADYAVPHAAVAQVMNACTENGIWKISFMAVQEDKTSKPGHPGRRRLSKLKGRAN